MVDRSRELYEQARVKMKAGAFAEAVELFEKSIRVYPHFKALELLGECLARLDRLTEAIVPLAAATTLNRGVRAPSLLADAFDRPGDIHDARAAARIALERDPSNRLAKRVLRTTGDDRTEG